MGLTGARRCVAGVGRGIRDACALAKASATRAGADALMIHTAADPFVSPVGTVRLCARAVADAAGRELR